MKAIGLIVEYNPFHNGHLYHLQTSKKHAKADVVVCVMSGYFLQRGEPASYSRQTRTKLALDAGADLVVELPYAYSSQHASLFARGSVSILNDLLIDSFYFGSEYGDIDAFKELDLFMQQHEQTLESHVKKRMNEGASYPRAQSEAFLELTPPTTFPDLSQPNNILGYQYVKSARELSASIKPETIQRTGSGYHSEDLEEKSAIASATAIRRALSNDELEDIRPFVPNETYAALTEHPLVSWDDYYKYLQHELLTTDISILASYYDVQEGLEYRLVNAAKKADSFQSFMNLVKTKRYTWVRIQRTLVHILTKTTKASMADALGANRQPSAVRLLGFSKAGQAYLSKVKKETTLQLYDRPPRQKNAQMRLDEKAAFAYWSYLPTSTRPDFYQREYEKPIVLSDRT
ncbi:nucleotidyltransferase [Geomicrobium sediminis]|uniref:tRNA(Met) cytidine acetate ligase n=1 Tax=Geomicrobium sediminis TaxID=1347788 RepID=A0ABS2PBW1_9BACL|nr:nucleotidyltransferase [Geomicrobium sediminis]MBM7632481.1 putative nucleotidyltransferase [Geomicrobium sediminis]